MIKGMSRERNAWTEDYKMPKGRVREYYYYKPKERQMIEWWVRLTEELQFSGE